MKKIIATNSIILAAALLATSASSGVAAGFGEAVKSLAAGPSDAKQARLSERGVQVIRSVEFAPEDDFQSGVWAQALYSTFKQDAIDGIEGYKNDSLGLMIGYDTILNKDTLVGVNAGYITTDVKAGGDSTSESKLKSFFFGGYATYDLYPAFVEGGLTYSSGDIDNTRIVQGVAGAADQSFSSTTKSSAFTGSVRVGQEFIQDEFRYTPFGALIVSNVTVDGFEEDNAAGGNYKFEKISDTFITSELGVELLFDASENQDYRASVAWRHEYSDDFNGPVRAAEQIGDGAFGDVEEYSSLSAGRDQGVFGIGTDFYLDDGFSVSLDYDLTLAKEAVGHAARITVGKEF